MEKCYISGHTYQPCYSRVGFTLREAPGTMGNFCNIFLPIIGQDQEKVLRSERGAMTLCHMVNPVLVIVLRS